MEEAGKDPIKRASLISSIVKSISVIPDSIVRSVYTRECSQLLQMEEKILIEAVNKLIEQAQENKYKEIQRKQRQATQDAQPAPPTTYPEHSRQRFLYRMRLSFLLLLWKQQQSIYLQLLNSQPDNPQALLFLRTITFRISHWKGTNRNCSTRRNSSSCK